MYRNDSAGIITANPIENNQAMFMKSIFTSAVTLLVCLAAISNPPAVAVYFKTADWNLSAEDQSQLQDFASKVDPAANFSIVVRGHADYRGSADQNHILGMNRAEAVRLFLTEQGLHPFELRIVSAGEESSAQDGSEFDIRNDRRVDIEYVEIEVESVEDLHEIIGYGNELENSIDPGEDNTIRTSRGSSLHIPANSLVDAYGDPITEPVKVELTEAFDPMEFLSENLATWSDDKILITDGMMKITATTEAGAVVEVADGSELIVTIPSDSVNPDIELFVSQDGQNWDATGQRNRQLFPNIPQAPTFRGVGMEPLEKYPGFIGEPMKPCVPSEPIEPTAPEWSDFSPEVYWWDILWRGIKIENAREVYAEELDKYDQRMEKYHRRVARYEREVESFPARKIKYQERVAIWEKDRENHHQNWCEEHYWPRWEDWAEQYSLARRVYEQRMSVWESERLQIMEEFVTTNPEASAYLVQGYVFGLTDFGWINCDRFLNSQEEMIMVNMRNDQLETNPVYVALNDVQSILTPYQMGDGKMRMNIPKSESGTIIAYRIEDEKIEMCVQELNCAELNKLRYEEVTLRELRQAVGDIIGA